MLLTKAVSFRNVGLLSEPLKQRADDLTTLFSKLTCLIGRSFQVRKNLILVSQIKTPTSWQRSNDCRGSSLSVTYYLLRPKHVLKGIDSKMCNLKFCLSILFLLNP